MIAIKKQLRQTAKLMNKILTYLLQSHRFLRHCLFRQDLKHSKETHTDVFHSATIMAAGTLTSRSVALIREMVLAAYFPRFVTDIWIVALRIPNLCRRLFGEGALSVAFIPIFVELLENNSKDQAKKLVDAVFSIMLISLLTIFMLGLIFAPQIVHWLTAGEGFAQIENKVALTIYFTRIMMVFLILVCLYAFFMSIQNSFKQFAIPALAPVFFNLSIVVAALLPSNLFDVSGEVLAWAVVIGGILQLAVMIPGVYHLGYLPRFRLKQSLTFKPVRKVFQKLLPSVIGVGVLQLTVLVNTRFASYLQEGANSWIFWADRLLELPLSLIAVSMGTALLPTLSKYSAQKQMNEISDLIHQSLRYVLFLGIPASIAFFILSELLVQVIFQRGHFKLEDVMYTSAVLRIYGIGIVAYGSIRVLQPAFYAIQNTWIPALISAICLAFHILLASYLLESYKIEGLAFSSIVSAMLNMFFLLLMYKFFIGPLEYLKMFLYLIRILLAAFVMAVGLKITVFYFSPESIGLRFLLLCVTCLIGLICYFKTALYLQCPEATNILNRIKNIQWLKFFNKK